MTSNPETGKGTNQSVLINHYMHVGLMNVLTFCLSLFLSLVTTLAFAQSACATLVKNIGFEKRAGNIEYVTKLTASTALFYAEDQYYGHELWRTDGTFQGTALVKDIAPGVTSSRNGYGYEEKLGATNKPVVQNGIMYFEANDGIHGYEVWRSDGTANGTFMLKDICTNEKWQNDQRNRYFFTYNNDVYFWDDSEDWFEPGTKTSGNLLRLFKTGGTAETTMLVASVKAGMFYRPEPLFEFKGQLCFVAELPTGTGARTKRIFYQISQGGNLSQVELQADGVYGIGVANGLLYFSNSKGLFKSDGTITGTAMVREKGSVFTGADQNSPFWGVGNLVYFLSNGNLWRTDGTMTGTYAIRNGIKFTNTDLQFERRIFIFKNQLHFVDWLSWDDRFKGLRLWKTDGTTAGTVPVVDLDPARQGDVSIRLLTEIEGNLYFYGRVEGVTADLDATAGIWKSDGTQGGTNIMCPLGPNLVCRMINPTFDDYGFVAIDKSLLFLGFPTGYTNNTYGDIELYRTNFITCPNIVTTISGPTAICPGGNTILSATASGGAGSYTYRWMQGTAAISTGASSLSINTVGDYTLTATDANGCIGTTQTTVTQRAVPSVTIPTTATSCSGQNTVLTATVTGGTGPYTWQWMQGTSIVGSSAATLTVTTGGTYAVTVRDAGGCVSASAVVTITQRPTPTATITASTLGFPTGGSAVLSTNAGAGQTYQWMRDGQSIPGAIQATYTTQLPGSYAVSISQNGCATTSQAVIISLITALEDYQSGDTFSLSVSPNPSPDRVEVQLQNKQGKPVAVSLFVYDLTGRSLYQKRLRLTINHTETLDLSTFPTGTYLIKAATETHQSHLRLIRQ